MDRLELKIPPVAVFVIVILLMNFAAENLMFAHIIFPFTWLVFLVCFIASGIVGLLGIREFRRVKTTVNPVKPETASLVVNSGIFAYTRNPMYLGLFILLFGVGYWLQNGLSLSLSVFFIVYMNRFQIQPEEKALERLFGAEYVDYKQSVRRWI
ncbi:isoprenylcysteine carboxylmethyltransferase family protein [Vibrio sp. YMD68]|uniref:methyltransferase family protein n=1 Tax=Vibrio sp. YMD68 TaxID=3042300 RepID=UPI00249A4F3D|nr:isoprenylcysteine carboxylmethyltransferase family protein [Vibrio sp. YMD68]WGV99185.1 isoprenylcysteine carboxylmethyltransferase family protein [Vibrio sp. YMD68]